MSETLLQYYLILKSVHMIFIITWVAGMIFLPHIFAYHARVASGSEADETFRVMERRLLRGIINPAMGIAFITGILLIIATKAGAPGTGYWIHAKLLLVLVMATVHGFLAIFRKHFDRGENTKSEAFFRIFSQVPMLTMILIVLVVVIKPF